MKKFIAITTSTVLLSLLGASGLNLNIIQKVNAAGTEYKTTSVEQFVTKLEGLNLIGTYKTALATIDKTACELNSKGICSNKVDNCSTNDCSNTKNCNTKGKALVYKSINLSNCKNASEVVKKLQENGLTNITTTNVKNIKALKSIINKIKKDTSCTNSSCNSQTTKKTTAANAKTTKKATPKPTTAPKPPTAPKPTTAPTTNNTGISSYATQVLELVNKERAKEGLSALTTNTTLTSAANLRAKETVQSFSHTRPNGTSFFSVLQEFSISYRTAGENIAYGQRSPQEVVTGWMNSPGHRANIMNASFGKIGIGVHKESNGTIYWTQVFTN